MKKYLSLVKLLFVQQYRVKPQQGKSKKGGTIALAVLLAVCFLPMLVSIAMSMFRLGQMSTQLDNVDSVVSVLIFTCQGLVLIFGIPTLMSTVFSAKDADKLLFLPVSSTTVFAAKFTAVYINEVITTAVTILAVLLPFGIGLQAGAAYYLMFVFALILIPLLPMLLGSIVAIPLSALLAKFSKSGTVKTIVQLVMFAGIMVLYMVGMYQLGLIGGDFEGDVENGADQMQFLLDKLRSLGPFAKYVHSNFTLAGAMLGASFAAVAVNLLISLAENVLLFGLVLLMALPFYRWMLSVSVEGDGVSRRKKSVKKGDLQVKNRGVVGQLILTDVKRVLRDSQMGFQCVLSLIMLPLMVGLFYFVFSIDTDGGGILSLSKEPLYQVIAPLVFIGYMTMLGVTSNVLGIYPISRENKAIYIIKSMPLSFEKYLLAKVILATVAMLVSDTVMCALVVALFGVNWYYGLLMLVTMALLGFGSMCITTLIDLKSPKLGWTNFNQSLKNAKNSWMGMLIGFICMIAIVLVSAAFIVGWTLTDGAWYMLLLMWLFIVGLSAGFAVVSYKVMRGRAQRYFDAIEP